MKFLRQCRRDRHCCRRRRWRKFEQQNPQEKFSGPSFYSKKKQVLRWKHGSVAYRPS